MERGFGPYEKTVLAALWLVPLVARTVAQVALIPLAVPVMMLAFALLLHRAMTETGRFARHDASAHRLAAE